MSTTATAYLVVVPRFSHRGDVVYGAKVKRATQRPPQILEESALVVKVKLTIPDEAFLPLKPAVQVTIPLEHGCPVVVESEPVVLPEPDDD